MLLCVFAVIIIILSSILVAKKDYIGYKLVLAYLFTSVISDSLLLCGILVPISGYEEPIVTESELMPIVNDSEVYIIQQSDGSVTCKLFNKDENKQELQTYIDNFEFVIDDGIKRPILKSSITKAKKTIFSLGLLERTEYTFYVPESNIERWPEKHVE